jgi:hypothetical protein
MRNTYKFSVGELERKRKLWKIKSVFENDIKFVFKQIMYEGVKWI